jgi:hypothetical protein
MKYLKICFVGLVISCSSTPVKKLPEMPGAYFMTSQTVHNSEGETNYTDLKQLKIYTGHYMMYTQVNPDDSASAFGVGSYTTDTSGVTENVIYSSRDSFFDNSPAQYRLTITPTTDGYNQFIPDIAIDSQKSSLTEVYQKVGTTVKSPLDGVWRETDAYDIRANDTATKNRTQYKAFFRGYFMFGHSVNDSTGMHTGVGFGTFGMQGDHQMKETDLNSTYAIITGQSFMIDVDMDGADHFKQTIHNPDGSSSVEIYERLK